MSSTVMERVRTKSVGLALGALLAATSTTALSAESEAAIRSSVERTYPGHKVSSVTETRVRGIYEVVAGSEVVYSDATGQTLFVGAMVDTATRTNLTQERVDKLTQVDFDDFPLEHAIKTVKGDGSRVIVAFEDPNCGYCKELHKGLKSLTNYTMYTFLYPLLGEDSKAKTNAIWCSENKEEALSAWMAQGMRPVASPEKCLTPTAKVSELAARLGVRGTPALFFADGTRNPGFLPADRLDRKLTESTRAAAAISARAGAGKDKKKEGAGGPL